MAPFGLWVQTTGPHTAFRQYQIQRAYYTFNHLSNWAVIMRFLYAGLVRTEEEKIQFLLRATHAILSRRATTVRGLTSWTLLGVTRCCMASNRSPPNILLITMGAGPANSYEKRPGLFKSCTSGVDDIMAPDVAESTPVKWCNKETHVVSADKSTALRLG